MQNPGLHIEHLEACLLIATADCDSVLELGCGTCHKLSVCPAEYREGVDAHLPYLDMARAKWGDHISSLNHIGAVEFVKDAVKRKKTWDGLLLIDFIEHLKKEEGLRLLSRCRRIVDKRIIVFCPEGETHLDKDAYDTGGDRWQTHRSYWWKKDLDDLEYSTARWKNFHGEISALFGTWEQP